MKIRTGFVSNSSSSSYFRLAKRDMTEKQIEEFTNWLKSPEGKFDSSYIWDTGPDFYGEMRVPRDNRKVDQFLSSLGIDRELYRHSL